MFGCTLRLGAAGITDRPGLARASPGATGPRGQAAHSVGSGQLCRSEPASGPRLSLPSPGRGVGCAQRRLRPTVSVRPRPHSMTRHPSPGRGTGRPQCRPRANCDGCAYPRPAFFQCITGLRGPGAHSVGQGLTVTAAPTS